MNHLNMPAGASSDPSAPFNSPAKQSGGSGEPDICIVGNCAKYALGRTERCEKHQERRRFVLEECSFSKAVIYGQLVVLFDLKEKTLCKWIANADSQATALRLGMIPVRLVEDSSAA